MIHIEDINKRAVAKQRTLNFSATHSFVDFLSRKKNNITLSLAKQDSLQDKGSRELRLRSWQQQLHHISPFVAG